MDNDKRLRKSTRKRKKEFFIQGRAELEEMDRLPNDVTLMAYAFDRSGQFVSKGELNARGQFNFPVPTEQPIDLELMIAPEGDSRVIRKSTAYSKHYSAEAWIEDEQRHLLKPEVFVARAVWWPWMPIRVCVTGHVRKAGGCPVPFVKVEVFDVDREGCWWPWILRRWEVLRDRRVIRIPELMMERDLLPKAHLGGATPLPVPPDEADMLRGTTLLGPQPEPPDRPVMMSEMAHVNPQPEPAVFSEMTPLTPIARAEAAFTRVGETKQLDPSIAAQLDNLTITGKLAPWHFFPWCFHSKERVCQTTTDESGYFRCCFRWWPFYFRRGRLRYDARPDIIIRVTQVIDGVETVLYMDPYSSTRWNVHNAHIDIRLDDEEIECGSGDEQTRPVGTQAFFTRIGDTEVYRINQTNGLYEQPPISNLAFGSNLVVHAQFGDNLSDGSPPRYYKLSYARHGSASFTPITTHLRDIRVDKVTNFSESHFLGPQTVNGTPGLYEIRDFDHYLWYYPDKIGTWISRLAELDTNKYALRLEVFDEHGNKLTSAAVDYRDGTSPPNGVLPSMTDQCDLIITLDNKAPQLDLTTPAINLCGVIPASSVPPLNFQVSASQENGRLRRWRLQYTKGVEPPPPHVLAGSVSNTGAPGSVLTTVDGTASPTGIDMTAGVTTTCAFALKLWAWAHITDGRNAGLDRPRFIYYREVIKAIALERCPSGS